MTDHVLAWKFVFDQLQQDIERTPGASREGSQFHVKQGLAVFARLILTGYQLAAMNYEPTEPRPRPHGLDDYQVRPGVVIKGELLDGAGVAYSRALDMWDGWAAGLGKDSMGPIAAVVAYTLEQTAKLIDHIEATSQEAEGAHYELSRAAARIRALYGAQDPATSFQRATVPAGARVPPMPGEIPESAKIKGPGHAELPGITPEPAPAGLYDKLLGLGYGFSEDPKGRGWYWYAGPRDHESASSPRFFDNLADAIRACGKFAGELPPRIDPDLEERANAKLAAAAARIRKLATRSRLHPHTPGDKAAE